MIKPAISLGMPILLISVMGCGNGVFGAGNDEIGEFNGVYVNCIGDGQQWATWNIGAGGGWTITDADSLQTCIGSPNMSGADDVPFTFDEWEMATNSFPAYHDKIAALCETKCWEFNTNQPLGAETENPNGVCSASGWDQNVAELGWTPQTGYNCHTMYANEGVVDDPFASSIDWSNGGTPLSLPLECSLLDACHVEFDGGIGPWTQAWEYGGPIGPIGPLERGADYYSTASTRTVLSIDMDAGDGRGYDDAEVLDGYAEYSASECGESTCPFYLASFSASNDADVWDVWVSLAGVFSEPKHIDNVQIDAVHSTLGAWRPHTGQVAFLPGTLTLGISFDVSSDCDTCSGLGDDHYDLVLRNDEVVFGAFSAGAFVLEQTFSVVDGDARLDVELNVDEGPPRAAMDLSREVRCNTPGGYALTAGDSASTDPDNDIAAEMWLVDGVAVPNGTNLSVGIHDVALGVADERGAWDFTKEQKVEVVRGLACI